MSKFIGAAIMAAAAALASGAQAAPVTLTFEGIADYSSIGNYYDGGAGGDYGISFGADSLALVASSAGGRGNFSNAPSGNTIAFFLSGPGDVMNVATGFDTGLSFYYAAQGDPGSVSVYDGLDGTGNLLATLSLTATPDPYTVFAPMGVSFAGTAKSVVFSGAANYIGFDNITLGASAPASAVPEPAAWTMMIGGIGAAGGMMRRRRRVTTRVAFA